MWLQNDPRNCITNQIFVHFSTFYESHILQIDVSEHLIAKATNKIKFKCIKSQNTKCSITTKILCILQFSWCKPVLDDSIHICVELTFVEDLSNESQIQKTIFVCFLFTATIMCILRLPIRCIFLIRYIFNSWLSIPHKNI